MITRSNTYTSLQPSWVKKMMIWKLTPGPRISNLHWVLNNLILFIFNCSIFDLWYVNFRYIAQQFSYADIYNFSRFSFLILQNIENSSLWYTGGLCWLSVDNLLLLLFSHSVVSSSLQATWAAARQASLSFTISQSLLKLMSIGSVMPSNHLILCHCLLLLPSIFPASGSFLMSWLFASGGQSIRISASATVLPVKFQDWFPIGWTGWISLLSKGLSGVFSNKTFRKHQFFGAQASLWSNCCRKGGPFQGLKLGSCLTLGNELSEETHVLTKQEILLGKGTQVESSRVREPRRTALLHDSQSRVLWWWD